MADNFPFTPGTGLTGSADDIGGGVLVQRVKVQYGADGSATDVAPGVGLPVAGQYAEVAGTAAALNADALASTDVRGYSRFSVQFSGTWTGTFNIQGSNDNTNWFTYFNVWAISGTGSPTANISSNGIYNGVITARYLRVRMLAYTSGTATVTTELSNTPGDPNVSINSGAALSCSVSSPSSASDGATVSTSQVQVSPALYNGATMDRLRSFGVQGAAGVSPVAGTSGGWSVYNGYGMVANVTTVKASAGQVGGWYIHNPGTATAYLQVFNTTSGVTLGTTSPTYIVAVPAGSAANLELTCGIAHSTGIQVACTSTATGNASPTGAGSNMVVTIFYK
jgi:hypothetical protein